MEPTVSQLSEAISREASQELDSALAKIRHCLEQLTEEQVWWRPALEMNSIANLVLHLCGNVRQWIVHGLGAAPDVRDRPREFSERGPIAKDDLLCRLEETLAAVKAGLRKTTPVELLRVRRIQGFEVTGLGAIFHSLPHFRGHTQEIIHLTRSLLGHRYKFSFVPTTPEQGASPARP